MSHSIVVVAGRMVRVRRQASTNLRTRSSAPVVALHSRSRFATAGPAGPPLPATPASRRATATSRWTCSATPCRRPGVDDAVNLYHDFASGLRDDRPGLDSCLRVLRKGDVLMVWKLDRLGRNLAHLVVVSDLRPLAGEHPQAHAAGRQILHGV